MQYTTNYNYSLPESDDVLETASRVGYNNNFSDIDTQIKDANDDIDSIGEEVDTISTQISAIDTQISTINTQIGAIDTRVDTIETHDYIVEQGTSGIWTYRKWNSGVAECWGKFTQNVSAYAQGAFIVGSASVSAYPFNFVSAPILTVMMQRVGTGGGYATYDYEKTNYANFIVNGSAPTPVGTALDVTAKCYVVGRWK